jgi:hypothetical protein
MCCRSSVAKTGRPRLGTFSVSVKAVRDNRRIELNVAIGWLNQQGIYWLVFKLTDPHGVAGVRRVLGPPIQRMLGKVFFLISRPTHLSRMFRSEDAVPP